MPSTSFSLASVQMNIGKVLNTYIYLADMQFTCTHCVDKVVQPVDGDVFWHSFGCPLVDC